LESIMHMAQVETWIRERAYSIWELEGRPQGRERQHWEQATREVMARGQGNPAAAAAAKAGKPAVKSSGRKGGKTRKAA
jgi:hypothetical protein